MGGRFDTQARARERRMAHSMGPNLMTSFRVDESLDYNHHHWIAVPFITLWHYASYLWSRLRQSWWGKALIVLAFFAPPLFLLIPVAAVVDIILHVIHALSTNKPDVERGISVTQSYLSRIRAHMHDQRERVKAGKGSTRVTLITTGLIWSAATSGNSSKDNNLRASRLQPKGRPRRRRSQFERRGLLHRHEER